MLKVDLAPKLSYLSHIGVLMRKPCSQLHAQIRV